MDDQAALRLIFEGKRHRFARLDLDGLAGGLIIKKYDSVTRQPLAGAQFKVMTANGELTPDNEGMTSSNGLYTTDVNGQIVLRSHGRSCPAP